MPKKLKYREWKKEAFETPFHSSVREMAVTLGILRLGGGKNSLLVKAKVSTGWVEEFE